MPTPNLRAGDGAGGAGAARHRATLALPMSVKVEDEGNHGCPRPGRSSVRNIALGLAETLNLNVTLC